MARALKAVPAADESAPTGAKSSKTRPGKILPTDRINFSKQLDLLRAFVAASGPSGRAVTNTDIAVIVGLKASTVSLANPFFSDNGLLQRVDGGYVPAAAVVSFQRAHEWNRDSAGQKLAPVIAETWFAQAVMPIVSYGATEESQIITRLGEASGTGPEYRTQLKTLVDYLEIAGLLQRDGLLLKLVKQAPNAAPSGPTPQVEPAAGAGAGDPKPVGQAKPLTVSMFSQPTEGVVQFHVSVRVDMAEFADWKADRITAFFAGVAQVLAAKGQIEKEGASE